MTPCDWCGTPHDRKGGTRFCSARCRDDMRQQVRAGQFTPEMTAQLYEDAKAGRIEAWNQK